ncbi:MAG: pantoate--beta-alanine ligase [Methylocystis sp.]|nr:pantoate--beta-alanine ligase [Methylocystis sp.]
MSATVAMTVPFVRAIADLREHVRVWRAAGERVALVPTMGALHAGHLSLVAEARRRAERAIVSIFVNPTQFGPAEDFANYPRSLDADLERLESVGADLCYAPSVETMYPQGFATTLHLEGPAKADLEDRFRPTHFSGVATVVAKLLNQAQADIAVFGEKDYQQLLVVRRLARDLDMKTQIIAAPTLREDDGLAMASRNVYLSLEERRAAPALYKALVDCARKIVAGEPIGDVMGKAREALATLGFSVDYLEARHGETLAHIARRQDGPVRLLVAARLGKTRLIDNLAV